MYLYFTLAECLDCGWKKSGSNSKMAASRHSDKERHDVVAKQYYVTSGWDKEALEELFEHVEKGD